MIDGDRETGTQANHDKAYDEWVAQTQPPAPRHRTATVADITSILTPLRPTKDRELPPRRKTALDNDWGPLSRIGLHNFLKQNHGGSLDAWLRVKWDYVGNNQWGPVMDAAATRADTGQLGGTLMRRTCAHHAALPH